MSPWGQSGDGQSNQAPESPQGKQLAHSDQRSQLPAIKRQNLENLGSGKNSENQSAVEKSELLGVPELGVRLWAQASGETLACRVLQDTLLPSSFYQRLGWQWGWSQSQCYRPLKAKRPWITGHKLQRNCWRPSEKSWGHLLLPKSSVPWKLKISVSCSSRRDLAKPPHNRRDVQYCSQHCLLCPYSLELTSTGKMLLSPCTPVLHTRLHEALF